jgi:hypothetical protein
VQVPHASHIVHEDEPLRFNEAVAAFHAEHRARDRPVG